MKNTRKLALGAIIAALYIVLTHAQNMLFPESTTMAIQFRLSEALCILAFFTPAAIPGLTLGCVIFNLTSGSSLPLDFLIGSVATLLATTGMWCSRNLKVKKLPLLGLLLPALSNSILVGWELDWVIGGGFWFNAICVAIGEAVVLLLPGSVLYFAIQSRSLARHLR